MAFTVEEFRDLLRLLEERPEWRAELRRAILTDELLTLPELVRTLAEAQRRTEVQITALAEAQRRSEERLTRVEDRLDRVEDRLDRVEDRLGRVEEQIAALAEAQRRSEDRLGRVEEQIAALAEAQRRTEVQVAALAEAQRRTEVQVAALAEAQRRTEARLDVMTIDIGELKGDSLERRYRERGPAYFARLVRRSRVLAVEEVMDLLEPAVEHGTLSVHEADEVALADLVIRGRRREDDAEVYLVVEISWGVGSFDVERAAHRAELLRRAGLLALPVVAGKAVLPEAVSRAREMQVWQVTDGQVVTPEP